MAETFDIPTPAICDDPACLNCRVNVLFAVAKALEARDDRADRSVEVEEGAVYTLAHAVVALMHEADIPLARQLATFHQVYRHVERIAATEARSGLPRQTHNPRNAQKH